MPKRKAQDKAAQDKARAEREAAEAKARVERGAAQSNARAERQAARAARSAASRARPAGPGAPPAAVPPSVDPTTIAGLASNVPNAALTAAVQTSPGYMLAPPLTPESFRQRIQGHETTPYSPTPQTPVSDGSQQVPQAAVVTPAPRTGITGGTPFVTPVQTAQPIPAPPTPRTPYSYLWDPQDDAVEEVDESVVLEEDPEVASGDETEDETKTHLLIPDPEFLKDVGRALIRLGTDEAWLKKNGVESNWTGGGPRSRYRTVAETPLPKTYEGMRIKQVCRWISTTVFLSLLGRNLKPTDIVEVQATVWPPAADRSPELWVSANKPRAINVMKELFASENAGARLEAMASDAHRILETHKAKTLALGYRVETHPPQLAEIIARPRAFATSPSRDDDEKAWATLEAAFGRPARVATGPTKGDFGEPDPGFHAERRLHHDIFKSRNGPDDRLDPNDVGGLKRPCVLCYFALYAPRDERDKFSHEVHNGLLWLSRAAAVGIEKLGKTPQEIAEKIILTVKKVYLSPEGALPSAAWSTDTPSPLVKK